MYSDFHHGSMGWHKRFDIKQTVSNRNDMVEFVQFKDPIIINESSSFSGMAGTF